MPLLVTDWPPYARPTPPMEEMESGKRYLSSQAQDPDLKRYLRKLERALVLMLYLAEFRPGEVQPLFDAAKFGEGGTLLGSNGKAWWHEAVESFGWNLTVFTDSLWKLRGGSFIGWQKNWPAPVGLTRKGMREALLLRKEGVEPWAPPIEPKPKVVAERVVVGIDPGVGGEHFGVVTKVNDDGTVTVMTSGIFDISMTPAMLKGRMLGKSMLRGQVIHEAIAGTMMQQGDSVTITETITLS